MVLGVQGSSAFYRGSPDLREVRSLEVALDERPEGEPRRAWVTLYDCSGAFFVLESTRDAGPAGATGTRNIDFAIASSIEELREAIDAPGIPHEPEAGVYVMPEHVRRFAAAILSPPEA